MKLPGFCTRETQKYQHTVMIGLRQVLPFLNHYHKCRRGERSLSSLKEGVENLRLLTWKNCWNTIREPINQAQSSQAFEYLLDLKSHHSVLYGSPGQTSSAIALTKASLFFISSQPSKFPSSWLANPHCGLTPILCSACSLVCPAPFAITSAAARIRSFTFSLSSSSGNLEVMTPRITFLWGGRWSRGSKLPARAVSYSK